MRTRVFDARTSHHDHEITEARALVRRAEAACAHMYQLAEDVARMAALTAQHARVLEARRRATTATKAMTAMTAVAEVAKVDDDHAGGGLASSSSSSSDRLRFSILVREAHDSTVWREHTGTVAELHRVVTETTPEDETVTRSEFAAFLRGTPHAVLERRILCVRCVGRY